MKKVDVSVQSYNKPESLIFTLLTLHKYCRDDIDTVWINDDQSELGVLEKYNNLKESDALFPWKIKTRVNTKRVGWWVSFCYGRVPKYASIVFLLKRIIWNFYKNKSFFVDLHDFRYQWAIDNTNKDRLLIIHDDVEFLGNVVGVLRASLRGQVEPGIAGELGQCWRCPHKEEGCTPSKILNGHRPDQFWPMTKKIDGDHKWACRINEWVVMVNIKVARDIAYSENVFFGNCDDGGDTGAYWFSRLISKNYSFSDPFMDQNDKNQLFKHWDGGVTGHSAWVDQGDGKNKYNSKKLSDRIYREFGYEV